MKKMKKLIALFIAVATMASLFVFNVSVSAEEDAPVQLTEEEFLLIEKLEALGAITNSYSADKFVTREDMAEIIAHYMKLSVVNGNASKSPFYDVSPKSEAYGAIKALYDLGVISGDGNLNFNPDRFVTYDEALVFLVNAVGHKIFASREGGYPTGYHRVAIRHGMLKELSVKNGTDYVKLTDVYRMMDAALSAASVETTYYGDGDIHYTLSNTETFLSNIYGIKKYRGVVTGNENTRLTTPDSSLNDEQIEIDGVVYDTPGYTYSYFLGYGVDYYLKTNSATDIELIYVEETKKANSVIRIDAEDIDTAKTTSERIYYEDEDEKEYHIDLLLGFDAIYNNQSWTGYGSMSTLLPTDGYVEALDNNDDGVYDLLFVYEYESYVVSGVDSYNEIIYEKTANTPISLDSDAHKVNIYHGNNTKDKAEFNDLSANQVVTVMRSKGTNKIISVYISNKTVSGKITGYQSDLGYLVEDNYYEAHPDYVAAEPLSVGLTGTFYLDINDKIVTYRYDATGDSAMYAAMAAMDYKITTFDAKISIRFYTEEGEMVERNLAEKVYIDNVRYDLTESSDVTNVLTIISNGYMNSGLYQVNKSYIFRFETTNSGEIKSLDLGGIGGEGKLNVLADSYEYLLVRFNGMFQAKATGAETKVFGRFDRTNGLMFSTPAEGNLDKTEQFEIISLGDFKDNKSYKSPTYSGNATNNLAGPISIYSDNTSEIPLVNLIMFEGWNASTADVSTTDTKIAVITDISDAVDTDGASVKKLYFMDGASALVASEIKYWKGTQNPDSALKDINTLTTATPPALAEIRAGVVIQYSKNDDGLIDTIRFVSEYDTSANSVVPLFYTAGTNPYEEFNLGVEKTNEDSLAVCEVIINDTNTNLMTVKVGVDEYILYTGAVTDCVLYNSSKEKATAINLSDLVPGDKFTARIIGYYGLAEMIVFR